MTNMTVSNVNGRGRATELSNVYWVDRDSSFRVQIERSGKVMSRTFAVGVHGSIEEAFEAAAKYRAELLAKYPPAGKPLPKTGNEAWQMLSSHPRRRPTSQLLEWMKSK
jgi:hypothetical protein